MSRTQTILGGLLAVQVVVLVVLNFTGMSGSAGAAEAHPLLPVLDSITASRIEIDGGEDTSVVLEKNAGGWSLADAGGYPVEDSKIQDMIDDLKTINVRRPVVSSDRYHGTLKVAEDEHERRVRIWQDAGGDPDVDLLVGTSPNYRISHVRINGEDPVYEARGISPSDLRAEAGSWIDKKFVSVPFEEITAVNITNENGTFKLDKTSGFWTVVEPTGVATADIDQTKVDAFVRSLAGR